LERQESQLELSYAALRVQGYDVATVTSKVREYMASLTDSDRLEIKIGKLSPELQARVPPLTVYLREADAHLKTFQTVYDIFNEAKLDYFIEKYRALAADLIGQIEGAGALSKLSPSRKKKLREIAAQMDIQYKAYHENKGKMGTPRDNQRIDGYRRFFKQLDKLVNVARVPYRSTGDRFHEIFAKINDWGQIFRSVAETLPRLPALISAITLRRNIIPKISNILNAVVRANGLHMEVTGKENISSTPNRHTLNVIVLNHSNPVLDVTAVGKLNLPKAVAMAGSTKNLPQRIQTALEENPGLVIVWDGRNPLKKILRLLKEGKLENLIVFPEATLHSGIGYELRPPMENFTSKLIPLLRRQGVDINIIPVTSTRNFRLREDWFHSLYDSLKLPVVVHESFSPQVIDFLYAAGDALTPARFIRQRWLDGMQDDAKLARDHFLGMPQVARLERNIASHLVRKRACGKMMGDMGG